MEIKTIVASAAMALLLSVNSFAVSTDTWGGGGGNSNFSTSGNWSFSSGSGPVASGDALVFDASGTSSTTLTSINDDDSGYTFSSLTFNGNLTGPLTMGGDAFTLTGGITNSNTTSGRNVTINNAITISGSQTWTTGTTTASTTILGGNLSDSSTTDILTLSTDPASPNTLLPSIQFTGSNSGYNGIISFTANSGLLLGSASAMTNGLIDLTSGSGGSGSDTSLWLTANSSSTPYTFGIAGVQTTGPRVNFGGYGLELTANNGGVGGANVYWDPGAGSNYAWSGSTSTTLTFEGSADTNPDTLNIGNATGTFTVSGTNKNFSTIQQGKNYGYVTLLDALAGGGSGLSLTSNLPLLTLTAATSTTTPLALTITSKNAIAAALSISNVNQLPGGNLNLNGGTLILNGVSWDSFAGVYGNGTGNSQYQITNGTSGGTVSGGIASVGNITIDTVGTNSSTFSNGFTLGSNVLTSSGTEYATGNVTLAANTTFSVSTGTLNFGGNSTLNSSGIYTLGTQIMTVSGTLTGKTGGTALTISGIGLASGTQVPVVELTGSNSGLSSIGFANGSGSGYGVLVTTSDAAFGGATVTLNSNTAGGGGISNEGWLLEFAGNDTSSESIAFNATNNVTTAAWGIGSYSGNDIYQGTSTIAASESTVSTVPVNWDAESGSSLQLGTTGTPATFTNNSNANKTLLYRKTGTGTVVINNVTYNGSDTKSPTFSVQNGSLLIENSTGSALGTGGTLTVAAGTTFGGSGSATGLSSFSIGSGTSSRAQVQVGLGGTDTTSTLTLQAAAGTITYTNFSYNLSTTGGNQLVLNNGGTGTALTLTTGSGASTLTLNVVGAVIAPNTSYVLMTDNTPFTGLTTVSGGSDVGSSTTDVITGGLSIAPNTYFGASTAGVTSGFYTGSYLYLTDNGQQIDVMVVPEPGTWAMMFGGLVILILVQRARRDKDV